MVKKQKAHTKWPLYWLPSSYELALLQATQRGDHNALQVLVADNLWFIKRLVKTFTPKNASETRRTEVLDQVLGLFEQCARELSLGDENLCFLEIVLEQAELRFKGAEREKRLREIHEAIACDRFTVLPSLDTPITHDTDTTLLDVTPGVVGTSAFTEVWDTQLREGFERFLSHLTKNERKVIEQHFVMGMDLPAIAKTMDVKINKVRSLLTLALRKLRDLVPAGYRHFSN